MSRTHQKSFAVIGVTLSDIYPREDWNFVFGLANSATRVGIFSMARYFEEFPKLPNNLENSTDPSSAKFLERICKVMCHEFCHMFGLKHCIYFDCLMNGSNHLKEADRRSIFLCPVCLRKMHYCLKFDIEKRYKQIGEFWNGRNDNYFAWISQRIARANNKSI